MACTLSFFVERNLPSQRAWTGQAVFSSQRNHKTWTCRPIWSRRTLFHLPRGMWVYPFFEPQEQAGNKSFKTKFKDIGISGFWMFLLRFSDCFVSILKCWPSPLFFSQASLVEQFPLLSFLILQSAVAVRCRCDRFRVPQKAVWTTSSIEAEHKHPACWDPLKRHRTDIVAMAIPHFRSVAIFSTSWPKAVQRKTLEDWKWAGFRIQCKPDFPCFVVMSTPNQGRLLNLHLIFLKKKQLHSNEEKPGKGKRPKAQTKGKEAIF